jgi:hypothetical protein
LIVRRTADETVGTIATAQISNSPIP